MHPGDKLDLMSAFVRHVFQTMSSYVDAAALPSAGRTMRIFQLWRFVFSSFEAKEKKTNPENVTVRFTLIPFAGINVSLGETGSLLLDANNSIQMT